METILACRSREQLIFQVMAALEKLGRGLWIKLGRNLRTQFKNKMRTIQVVSLQPKSKNFSQLLKWSKKITILMTQILPGGKSKNRNKRVLLSSQSFQVKPQQKRYSMLSNSRLRESLKSSKSSRKLLLGHTLC